MPILDRRDEFVASKSNLDTVAAEATRLNESAEFRDDVVDALGPVFKQHLDCEAVDAAAEDVLREWVADEGLSGLFELRNWIVSVRDADLDEGDIIRMEDAREHSAGDIEFVVWDAPPESTGVKVLRVDPRTGKTTHSDLSAGHVKYVDRFEVDRSRRGERPDQIAAELAEAATDER